MLLLMHKFFYCLGKAYISSLSRCGRYLQFLLCVIHTDSCCAYENTVVLSVQGCYKIITLWSFDIYIYIYIETVKVDSLFRIFPNQTTVVLVPYAISD